MAKSFKNLVAAGFQYDFDWEPPSERELRRVIDDLAEVQHRLEHTQDLLRRFQRPTVRYIAGQGIERKLRAMRGQPTKAKRR